MVGEKTAKRGGLWQNTVMKPWGRWRQTGGLELPLQLLLALGPWEDSLHAVSLSFLIC